jgi:uncharacterized protein (TIGR02246 family)
MPVILTLRKLSAAERENSEAAIRDVFNAGCAAWNRGDLDGYLASYWDSDQTIWISSGSLRRGREAIVAAYKARFSTPRQMGKIHVAGLEIDVLTTTDAVAFGRWMLVLDKETSEGFFTVRLKKLEGTWFFVSDHSSTAKTSRRSRSEP